MGRVIAFVTGMEIDSTLGLSKVCCNLSVAVLFRTPTILETGTVLKYRSEWKIYDTQTQSVML